MYTLYTHLDYFVGLQEASREEGGRVQVKDLLRYSRLYRSVLHECVLGLGKMATGQLMYSCTNLTPSLSLRVSIDSIHARESLGKRG